MKTRARGEHEGPPVERRLPATSAAPVSLEAGDGRTHFAMARELAVELEGRRRSLTLGGSLLMIPATAGATLAISAAVGVSGFWLPVCALAGLTIGLSISTVAMAVSNLIGGALVRHRYLRQARALGLSDERVEEAWREAERELDERSRARLLRRPDAIVPLALDDGTRQG